MDGRTDHGRCEVLLDLLLAADLVVNLDQHPVARRDGTQGAFAFERGLGHGQGFDGLQHAVGIGPQPHPPLFERRQIGEAVIHHVHNGYDAGVFRGGDNSPALLKFLNREVIKVKFVILKI